MTGAEIVREAMKNETFKMIVDSLVQVNPDMFANECKFATLVEIAKQYI